jgi:hypothetical protein
MDVIYIYCYPAWSTKRFPSSCLLFSVMVLSYSPVKWFEQGFRRFQQKLEELQSKIFYIILIHVLCIVIIIIIIIIINNTCTNNITKVYVITVCVMYYIRLHRDSVVIYT